MVRTVVFPPWTQVLIISAAFVVVIAGMRVAAPVLIPIFLSIFIAIICWPALFWMNKKGLPPWLAVLFVLSGLIVVLTGLAVILGTSIDGFVRNVPVYQARLTQETSDLFIWLDDHGVDVSDAALMNLLNPGKVMRMAANAISGFGSAFTNIMMILFTVVFIFFEAFVLPEKLRMAFGSNFNKENFDNFLEGVRRYLGIKSATSAITGLAVALLLDLLGVDFPILWGVVAFLLNFIPNIGSIIAAIPAVLLALVQIGLETAFYALIGFLVINTLVGTVIEPRIMGKGLGLSTLVVFLSLIFWGWVFGPTGMFLSVPFTMILKIAFESNKETRWISVLLGSGSQPFTNVDSQTVKKS